ncbi:MAG TPA: C-terminal binding protein [Gemmataceae bacterium]|nr:C-terminal binding protein [Gemmataceae bacterium]
MPHRPLVVVTDAVAEPGAETKVLDGVADLKLLQTDDEKVVAEGAADADVLLVFHTIKIGERTLARLTRCKGIVRCGVGYDNVDIHAAGAHGIVVCNVPDYGAEEVADHALMLLLATARRLLPAHQALRDGTWDTTLVFGAPRLRGRTLGLIGCGRIGTAMALRAKALGMRVVAYDPYRPDGLDKALGIERVYTLEELLPQAQFLSLHCPLTRETRHILNERTLALLPDGAYVVNTARGPCVDLPALANALDAGRVAAAALDVFENEPLDDERIRRHPRVLLTPHAAFYSAEGWIEMRTKGALEGRRLLLGEAVRNPVNLHCLVNPRAVIPRLSPPEA